MTSQSPDRESAFVLANRYVDELIELAPVFATALGVPGHDHEWGESFGIEGHEARMDLIRRYRAGFAACLDHPDSAQRLAARVMIGNLDEALAADQAGEHLRDLAHMASSFQRIRSSFDVMRTDSKEGWEAICARLETIDRPYAQYRERLALGRANGYLVPLRQVNSAIDQARRLAEPGSAFDQLVARGKEMMPDLADRLSAGAEYARAVMADFAAHLDREVAPTAPVEDGAGEARYRLAADRLVGLAVDPFEAYEWGWDEFHRLRRAMAELAEEISPGSTIEEVTRLLETDPTRCAASPEEFLSFIDARLTDARVRLDGSHFEVDRRIAPLTVNLAPSGSPLGAYYLRPSEDFSRAGGVWYSVGDQVIFPLYHQVSTAYHEGFPGHHLQNGTAMVRADRISRAQRLTIWYPGYGEGWAMYAERLMGELGFFEKPDYEFGMLAKHLYRASRVVVDIGLHLGLGVSSTSPMDPGEPWTFDRAVEFMRVFGFRTRDQAVGEVKRYLGWPGQAIAYKLGEREFLAIRAESERRLGERFDLTRFHAEAIGNGAMRLDLLRQIMRERLG